MAISLRVPLDSDSIGLTVGVIWSYSVVDTGSWSAGGSYFHDSIRNTASSEIEAME